MKISYLIQWNYNYSYPLFENSKNFKIINLDIPDNWIIVNKNGKIIISYPEMAEDLDYFFDKILNANPKAVSIHKQRKAEIDAELKEINYQKMLGKFMSKLNSYKIKCDKFELNISDIINLELEIKEPKKEINFINIKGNSWIYINADSSKFEASASSDNLLQILKFGCSWLYSENI